MIEDSSVLTIKNNFNRPSANQIKSFESYQTGHVVDAMDGRGAMSGKIKPLNPKISNFVGSALTCYCGPSDNLAAIAATGLSQKGDVIIASTDKYKGAAVMGDLMLGIAKNRGVSAFITDGYVRDTAGINKLSLPCFSIGSIPNSPARNGPGNVGFSIICGDINVNSGDIIIGDIDGVVVVPYSEIETVLNKLKQVVNLEKKAEYIVNKGAKSTDLMDKILKNSKLID